jgi:GNAT superfamily N-acetyltransferase
MSSQRPTREVSQGGLRRLVARGIRLLRAGQFQIVLRVARAWFYSTSFAYGLRRDLTVAVDVADPAIAVSIRPLEPQDIPVFAEIDHSRHHRAVARLRFESGLLLASDIRTCYVAVTEDGSPCYMQYLILPSENDQVDKFFEGIFPRLADDEALLEAAYTLEEYRGKGIMPFVMDHLAQEARDRGARWLVTFVATENVPSLKGCKRAGFVPYLLRGQIHRLFRRRITFTALPEGTPYPFDAPSDPAA